MEQLEIMEKVTEILIIISLLSVLTAGALYYYYYDEMKIDTCELCSELNPNLSICLNVGYNEIPNFNVTTDT